MRDTLHNFRDPVRGRRKLLIASIAVAVVLLFDIVTGGALRGLLRSAGSALWGSASTVTGSMSETGLFASRRALAHENARLKEELAELRSHGAEYDVLQKENESLRTLLRAVQNERGVAAPVISSVHASPYGTFLIGAGSSDGISKGALVLAGAEEGGFVVGTVSEVRPGSSLVTAVFAPNASLEARVAGASVEIEGQGGGNARAEAPRGIAIGVGDPVTAPSFGGRAIGLVGEVEADAALSFQKLYMYLPVALADIRHVYVVNVE